MYWINMMTQEKKQTIYYLSKKFKDCKSYYSMMEKICCGLV